MNRVENLCIVIATNNYNYVPLEDAECVFCHPTQLSHAPVNGLKFELTLVLLIF